MQTVNGQIPSAASKVERRNMASRDALLRRVSSEFDEMRGTSVTLPQATRLFGLSREICERIFVRAITEGHMRRSLDGRFRRSFDAA
jgi:hypothetical protein